MTTVSPAFSIDWLEKDRTILIAIHQALIADKDVAEIQARSSEYYRNARRNLHAIIDIRKLENNNSQDVNGSLGNIRPISDKYHGATIIVVAATNPLLKFKAGATMEALGRAFYLCSTMDEALLILADLE
jgi:hypothetical protein